MHNSSKKAWEPGTQVKMMYKTGLYAGELVEINGPRAVVKVLAVLKHPEQGDLHHPYEPDVPFFHERRALSYTEKALAPLGDVELYEADIPDYRESLERSLHGEINRIDKLKRWSERALEQLHRLQTEY
ncbi:kinase [Paenibacillaceae bacterium]|nr:kinase [Paenibacillaceae bacterium]